jgi:hypothetical protein
VKHRTGMIILTTEVDDDAVCVGQAIECVP